MAVTDGSAGLWVIEPAIEGKPRILAFVQYLPNAAAAHPAEVGELLLAAKEADDVLM
jgi:hypothetical protein